MVSCGQGTPKLVEVHFLRISHRNRGRLTLHNDTWRGRDSIHHYYVWRQWCTGGQSKLGDALADQVKAVFGVAGGNSSNSSSNLGINGSSFLSKLNPFGRGARKKQGQAASRKVKDAEASKPDPSRSGAVEENAAAQGEGRKGGADRRRASEQDEEPQPAPQREESGPERAGSDSDSSVLRPSAGEGAAKAKDKGQAEAKSKGSFGFFDATVKKIGQQAAWKKRKPRAGF